MDGFGEDFRASVSMGRVRRPLGAPGLPGAADKSGGDSRSMKEVTNVNAKLLLAATVVCFGVVCIGEATAASGGHVLGGVSKHGWPVEVELAGKQNKIKQVTIGLDLGCTSGDLFSRPDRVTAGHPLCAEGTAGISTSAHVGLIRQATSSAVGGPLRRLPAPKSVAMLAVR